jgi:hypothetical protein
MNRKLSSPESDQATDATSLSKWIRSHTPDYWSFVKRSSPPALNDYLRFVGTVSGDPHLGNFGPIPVTTIDGCREMRFVNIDFDDAGRAPFVLDFVRYLAAMRSQCKSMKSKVLQKAYVLGLTGKTVPPPKRVRDFLKMSVSAYDKRATKYLQTHCPDGEFKYKVGEIQPYGNRIKPSTIKKLFPREQVIAIADRIEGEGGSADEARIWVLVEGADSRRRIMELKGYARPGTANYGIQPPVNRWLSDIREAYWPKLSGSDYDLINVPGAGRFWVREKKVSLINVPYTSRKKSQLDFVMALAIFDANVLGLAHGRQAHGPAYLAAIQKDADGFHQATKQAEKAYLLEAAAAMKQARRASRKR